MPNDAKLGLIAGVALVLLIAALFFRKEPGSSQAASDTPSAPSVPAPSVQPPVQTPAAPETKLSPIVPTAPPAIPPADYEFPPLPPPPPLSESLP
jgi:hypothetical protein